MATVMNHYPKILTLQRICYIKLSILAVAYVVTCLDQIRLQHPISQVGLKGPAAFLAKYITTRNPPMKLQSEVLGQRFILEISLEANRSHLPQSRYSLSFTHVHRGKSDKTARSVPSTSKRQKHSFYKKERLSYPLPPSIMEDSVKHNIAQTASTSKAYIPCPSSS